jgi:predicted GNAT family acetyltransferase
MHLLDRPVWLSLTTHHAHLSEGNALARRFMPDVNLFASACDDSPAALAALAGLMNPDESLFILQVPHIVIPAADLAVVKEAKGVQMVASRSFAPESDFDGMVDLGDQDAPEMLALAQLTEPGPFLRRTHAMGNFVGIRIGGRLAAMAGERLRFPGYTEVSGVCTHPDFRGRGFARRLSTAVAARIEARGDQPFLHAWRTNQPAIELYETLGFRLRAEVNVIVLKRDPLSAVRHRMT